MPGTAPSSTRSLVRLRLLQKYHRKHCATSAREAPLAYRRYQAPLALGINLFFPVLAGSAPERELRNSQ
jgi:hypothetical protein